MGVDAEMFVRIRGQENWLKPEDELRTAYDLASTIGPENFSIWTERDTFTTLRHHALTIMTPLTAEEAEEYGIPSSDVGKVIWGQDGPDIEAAPDEQFIRIHLSTRYYGENYARGDWPTIRATIEWLTKRFPSGEVWYGGDSSGICAEPMTSARVSDLNNFYLGNGRKTYTRYKSEFSRQVTLPACPTCKVEMIDCGGGQGKTFCYCDGCDAKKIVGPGIDLTVPRGKDFFEASRGEASVAEGKA